MKHTKIRSYNKRGGRGHYILPLLLFFCLFPLVMSGFQTIEKQSIVIENSPGQVWVLEKHFWGEKWIEMEEYLVGMLAATIPQDYEKETLKAQAIILRSFCMTQMKKENGKKVIHDDIIQDYYLGEKQREVLWQDAYGEYEAKMKEIISETRGILLVCDGDIMNPPFFRLSNGATRDVGEYILQKEKYPYMKSVDCKGDMLADNYIQYVEMTQKEFEKRLKKLLPGDEQKIQKLVSYKDEKGYVKEVEINGVRMEGERFRQAFDLASSSFTLQKINSIIEIQTKGIGHGFGFSQWSANALAKEGLTYEELLHHFYKNITLEKI